jgi:recombination protein RecT
MSDNNVTDKNFVVLKELLNKQSCEFQKVLPSHIKPDKFIRVIFSAVRKNPTLINVDRRSLLSACMDAAEDGLILDGYEAALIVRKGRVSYEPMYHGVLKLAYQTGNIKSMRALVVYENDTFSYSVTDDGEHIEYIPLLKGDRGHPYLTFSQAILHTGGSYIEIMTEQEIQSIRRLSQARESPWNGPFVDEMRKKTVLKRMCKMLPYSIIHDRAYASDDDSFNEEYEYEECNKQNKSDDTHKKPKKTLELLNIYDASVMNDMESEETTETKEIDDGQE